jgi:osmoprotectant transport system ATP-binding protein
MSEAAIALEGVEHAFGGVPVLRGVDLAIARGTLTVLIGPSGCGKSTTLRMMNRLIAPDRGRVVIEGAAGEAPHVLRRRIGYAIQAAGLFPHWSVARNIGAVPALLGWDRARIEARVAELMALLRLPPALASALPAQLSGGQAQRVGVARALAADPPIVLMDEPFGALDPPTRMALQGELRRIQQGSGKTVVLVTHDMDEALAIADTIVLMQDGRVAQEGSPAELMERPASDFVRGFVGGETPGLRLLSVRRVAERMGDAGAAAAGAPAIEAGASLREALERLLETGAEALRVTGEDGATVGSLTRAEVLR